MSSRQIIFTSVESGDAIISGDSHPYVSPGKAPQMVQSLTITPFVSARWHKPHSSLTVASVQWLLLFGYSVLS